MDCHDFVYRKLYNSSLHLMQLKSSLRQLFWHRNVIRCYCGPRGYFFFMLSLHFLEVQFMFDGYTIL